jgi:hypothetical protein
MCTNGSLQTNVSNCFFLGNKYFKRDLGNTDKKALSLIPEKRESKGGLSPILELADSDMVK